MQGCFGLLAKLNGLKVHFARHPAPSTLQLIYASFKLPPSSSNLLGDDKEQALQNPLPPFVWKSVPAILSLSSTLLDLALRPWPPACPISILSPSWSMGASPRDDTEMPPSHF